MRENFVTLKNISLSLPHNMVWCAHCTTLGVQKRSLNLLKLNSMFNFINHLRK